jgi:hypothetical protein
MEMLKAVNRTVNRSVKFYKLLPHNEINHVEEYNDSTDRMIRLLEKDLYLVLFNYSSILPLTNLSIEKQIVMW